jgi:uncharacterized membrane protein YgcG/tetratricopeptide (TPR) repeat protein
MKLSIHRSLEWLLLLSFGTILLFFLGVTQLAQTKTQLPARTGHVNDFAGVVDEKTRQQLEDILEDLKQKTGIEFDIATVESTAGQDIFDFSQQLAQEWNIGARASVRKSLLLVISVNDKASFTQFSKSVQRELPEGVLGEMSQRMRALVNAGQFSEGLSAGVQHFVSSMGGKTAFSSEGLAKTPSTVSATNPPATESLSNKATDETGAAATRPRTVESSPATVGTSSTREKNVPDRAKKAVAPVDEEAESEEVELTLTLPLEARVVKLKAFLDDHPDSKSKARATELLVSAQAALGDERLKNGDSSGGIEKLMQAIADAPISASEKLFSGVIAQIPLNLYLRGELAASAQAAQTIEAKFGGDPKRLLAVAGFYIGTEQASEATRTATKAVQLAPDMADAHQALALALHISLRLDEAVAEYKRALELDPNAKGARRSLADLSRAFGRSEEALALYRQQLTSEPNDKAARAGMVLSLLDLGRTDEAKGELEKALEADPRNLSLLAGAAYWFAAHNESKLALALGSKAIEIEPRYTWSQVAVGRALIDQKKPLEAERAVRYARQYAKFPTLDYELATALVSAGLYDEAAEILMQSFSVKDNQIEARLARRASMRSANFIELLAPERRASLFQSVAADTDNNAKTLKALLTFATAVNQERNGGTISEEGTVAAAKEFAAGDDAARVYRQLYAASQLLQKGIGYQTVYELAEAARNSVDAGLDFPAATIAAQADEYREIRARAIASGGTPSVPEAPRNLLSNLLRGRIEDISGWSLFNQDKLEEAIDHLKRAANILPEGTPAWRAAWWHLGATLDRMDKKEEALASYIKSYNAGEPDAVRRTVIERLYRKLKGSLAGLDEQIGATPTVAVNAVTPSSSSVTNETANPSAQTVSSPESIPTPTPVIPAPAGEASPTPSATPVSDSSPEVVPTPKPSPESSAPAEPQLSPTPSSEPAANPTPTPDSPALTEPQPSPTPSPEAAPSPTPTPEQPKAPSTSPTSEPTPGETTPAPRATVRITGMIKDAGNSPIANVVVVLINPLGTVLASTTNDQGRYSFIVVPSAHSYRIIPSKDGFTFDPIDRVLPGVSDDQKELDFIGAANRRP